MRERHQPVADQILDIESVDLEAQGIARRDGKVVFVRGALAGERVRAAIVRRKPKYEVAQTHEVLRESSARVRPLCPHFGVCGGCSMQHVDPRAQLAIKQRALEDQLRHLAGVRPRLMLRAMAGPAWGYRQRARLSVRNVPKKGGVLVGFHERASSYVADMRQCLVLPPRIDALLLPLRGLIAGLDIRDRVPQIEVAGGDDSLALVFRILDVPSPGDREAMIGFALRHRIELWWQPKGPDTIVLVCDGLEHPGPPADTPLPGPQLSPLAAAAAASALPVERSALGYRLPEYEVWMPFRPTDFTQVNHAINRVLVQRAVELLACEEGERVADLFCGLGNFSLPLARRVGGSGQVLGLEGSATLTARAEDNARRNGLESRVSFGTADLFQMTVEAWRGLGAFDRVLIDPPREGALEVARAIAADPHRLRRIVYVSCNPATLARDAGLLVHQGGYRLQAAGAINMFPQTSHIESMAVFEPDPDWVPGAAEVEPLGLPEESIQRDSD